MACIYTPLLSCAESRRAYNAQVRIVLDEEAGVFMIQDNGIGMSHDDLRDNLGTIARSGSKQFLKEISQSGTTDTAKNIIGRFGVGFYSYFMVAEEVRCLCCVSLIFWLCCVCVCCLFVCA